VAGGVLIIAILTAPAWGSAVLGGAAAAAVVGVILITPNSASASELPADYADGFTGYAV
jgi:hypothetical protein